MSERDTTIAYTVEGMTCGGCASKVTRAVEGLPGVTGTHVVVASGTLNITGADVDDAAVRQAISEAGYSVR
ncbi:heavy-metal-associated domain-containing protein [Nocardioides sp. SOB77]|uniref:Heavy-metal-associated domain-containing protein n=1 Tax=Nocardioides oceani TaxID=3058369 RepID=A0ABT8FM82_9ACTN|nr:heavy-metal-associated domain-containing protein [Nocardioides oceani]MDN4175786.1 heavy-metal-associated domain-containing protein [Nocardioides oceani]